MERVTPTVGRRRPRWSFPWRSLLFLVALGVVVRAFFCSVLRVPTGSMEPTIHGDIVHGDEMLVFSPWFKLFDPERFDLAVFERPDDEPTEKTNVKRIAGLPGESVRVEDGDLFITSQGGSTEKRLQKPYEEFRPLLVRRFFERFGADFERHFGFDPATVRPEVRGVALIGGENEGRAAEISLDPRAVTLDDGWMDDAGEDHAGQEVEKDLLFDIEIALTKATTCLNLSFLIGVQTYSFDIVPYGAGHAIMFSRSDDAKQDPESYRASIKFLTTGAKHRIEFFQIDGQAGVAINGRRELCEALPSSGSSLGAGRGASNVKLAVWAGDAKVTKFEVWRDLHYTTPSGGSYAGRGNAYKIPPDGVFVLGDCSRDSIDSRFYGPVPLQNLRGLPFLVWSPGSRRRFLH